MIKKIKTLISEVLMDWTSPCKYCEPGDAYEPEFICGLHKWIGRIEEQ